METGDLTSVAVRALVLCATSATTTATATNNERFYTTQIVADSAVKVIQDEELPINVEDITADKMGRVLAKMRFKKGRHQLIGSRGWIVPHADIIRWCERYGLEVPPEVESLSTSGSSGTSGVVAGEKQLKLA